MWFICFLCNLLTRNQHNPTLLFSLLLLIMYYFEYYCYCQFSSFPACYLMRSTLYSYYFLIFHCDVVFRICNCWHLANRLHRRCFYFAYSFLITWASNCYFCHSLWVNVFCNERKCYWWLFNCKLSLRRLVSWRYNSFLVVGFLINWCQKIRHYGKLCYCLK